MKMKEAFEKVKELANGADCSVQYRMTSYDDKVCYGYINRLKNACHYGNTWEDILQSMNNSKQVPPDEE